MEPAATPSAEGDRSTSSATDPLRVPSTEQRSTSSGAPMLLRLRSGKIAAAALIFGFGGGIMLLALGTAASVASEGFSIWGTLIGYALMALPFVLLGVGVALCRSELWLVPEERALRLLTYRPWRRGPRVEQASLDEYAGVMAERASDGEGGGAMVSLVLKNGERVELRQFKPADGAVDFAKDLAARAGLWLRGELANDTSLPTT